jgi:hypothetical protein
MHISLQLTDILSEISTTYFTIRSSLLLLQADIYRNSACCIFSLSHAISSAKMGEGDEK